jgi:hypothetical protein
VKWSVTLNSRLGCAPPPVVSPTIVDPDVAVLADGAKIGLQRVRQDLAIGNGVVRAPARARLDRCRHGVGFLGSMYSAFMADPIAPISVSHSAELMGSAADALAAVSARGMSYNGSCFTSDPPAGSMSQGPGCDHFDDAILMDICALAAREIGTLQERGITRMRVAGRAAGRAA